MKTVFEMSDIKPHTQNHLAKVYAVLGTGVVTALFSGLLMAKGFLPVFIPFAVFILTTIAEIVLFFAHSTKFGHIYLKPGTFFGYAIAFGSSIGFTFLMVDDVEDQKLLGQVTMSAFIYSLSIFAAFSIFAMLTVRRTQIFLYSIISCLVLSLISIFVWNTTAAGIIGLIVGILYVIIDTQIIINKTENGIYDTFTDAKQLLIDLFKIFIEIMKLLMSDKKKKNKD